ncbi:MAG TPA: dipeptidase [Mycobacteriales bacterium]|nr:dipeptidase [Mycobacteriales bacterium]
MTDTTDRVTRLLEASPVVDGHNDLPWALRLADADLDELDVAGPLPQFHTDLDRLTRGGVGTQWWSVYVPSTLPDDEALRTTIEQVHLVRRMVEQHPDRLRLALNADDARAAMASGRIASLIGAEGGHSIGGTLSGLWALHALGVRYMTLTHNDNTSWADSATDEPVAHGLTDFGRDVVRRMNALGVVVDLSHVSPATMAAALATTSKPVMFSHSSARGLVDHPRNVPDDILRELSTNGGLCMVAFVPQFVSKEFREWDDAGREGTKPTVTPADVADHIEHVRDVAGVDAVGLGGDYDGCPDFPVGLEDVSGYPRLLDELVDRSWSDDDLMKLTGRNAIRVLSDN